MVIDVISNKIGNYIFINCVINESDKEKIIYALNAILGEIIKIIILLIIFLFLHRIKFFLFSIIILISIRPFSGGIHLKTFTQCLLFSTAVFFITSLIAPALPKIYTPTYYGIATLSFLLIAVKSPCPNIKRPIKNVNRLVYLKVLSILFTTLWIAILFSYISDISLFNCGLCTILIQSLQLILSSRRC